SACPFLLRLTRPATYCRTEEQRIDTTQKVFLVVLSAEARKPAGSDSMPSMPSASSFTVQTFTIALPLRGVALRTRPEDTNKCRRSATRAMFLCHVRTALWASLGLRNAGRRPDRCSFVTLRHKFQE